ncbi:MAG TPA: penicillin-binding protein 2, partial [Thiotrichales bacterium]|nr:penicillin-binding protein 2 [Thiotrichales bacterium]
MKLPGRKKQASARRRKASAKTARKVSRGTKKTLMPWRRLSVLLVFFVAVSVLVGKALDMQVLRSEFYQQQGKARQVRTVSIAAHRGDIVDRNGQPLAISAPVESIWINPGEVQDELDALSPLAKLLSLDEISLREKIRRNSQREFMYLKRHASPELAAQALTLSVPGVSTQNEYHRYYPSGEVSAHVLGFVDIDDNGQEGIERAYDKSLKGVPGKKRVMRDRLGRVFEDIERIAPVQPGQTIALSIDKRLQYLTYRTLKAAVIKHNAVAGSAVVLDVKTGEVLAMANQPSFNVNDRKQLTPQATRNRA